MTPILFLQFKERQIQGRSAPPLLNYKFRRCAMGTQYSHLSNFERCRLFECYHYQKKSIREVSRLLNRSHSTISRELKRKN